MKFRFNRQTQRVEPQAPIPNQRGARSRVRQMLGLEPLPEPPKTVVRTQLPPPSWDALHLTIQQAAEEYAQRVAQQLIYPPSIGGQVGRNRNTPSPVYGYSPGTPNPSTGCWCPLCTGYGSLGPDAWKSKRHSDIPSAGIRAGELIGYRSWRVEHGLLESISRNNIWYPHKQMTGDVKTFGVFSWNTEGLAYSQAKDWLDSRDWFYILGTIYHWGEVVEHAHGFRSERAEVRSLDRFVYEERFISRWLGNATVEQVDLFLNKNLPDLNALRKLYGVKS